MPVSLVGKVSDILDMDCVLEKCFEFVKICYCDILENAVVIILV